MGETHVEQAEVVEANEHKNSQERIAGMRKKVDLTDIILEKEKKTANKKKSLILALASFILIFLVFLILSKLFNSDDSSKVVSDEQNNSSKQIVLNQTKENPPADATKVDEQKAVSDTDLKFEEMVKKLRAEDEKENKTQIVQEKVEPSTTTQQVKKPEIKKVLTDAVKHNTPDIKKVKQEIKQLTSPISITEAKPSPKKNIKHIVKHAPAIKKPTRGAFISDAAGYFVQVGAQISPEPNRGLASKIRANGYSFQTHPIYVKGRKFYKVLVGPYTTKAEAKAQLGNIRATINPKAFLYHLR